jgi:hypothetical protein
MPAFAQNPPETLNLNNVRFQIVDTAFVTKLEAGSNRFEETHPDKYHGLIVTLKITKEAGTEFTVACQDINIHYRYGQQSDIARCYGLSNYSTQQNEDRSMSLYGQGWGRSTTGLASTKSSTAYIDVFFQNMEPDTSDLYLFISQPTGAHYISQGWKGAASEAPAPSSPGGPLPSTPGGVGTPSVSGTTWSGVDSLGKHYDYEFRTDGSLRYSYETGSFTDGIWRQDGDSIYMAMNNKYSERQGRITGTHMGGNAWNVVGLKWTWAADKR